MTLPDKDIIRLAKWLCFGSSLRQLLIVNAEGNYRDALQNTVVYVLASLETYDESDRSHTMTTHVHNGVKWQALNSLRDRKKKDVRGFVVDPYEPRPSKAYTDSGFAAFDALDELKPLLKNTTSRRRQVLEMRYGVCGKRAMSLVDCGKELGLSKERIRQIEYRAISDIRESIAEQRRRRKS